VVGGGCVWGPKNTLKPVKNLPTRGKKLPPRGPKGNWAQHVAERRSENLYKNLYRIQWKQPEGMPYERGAWRAQTGFSNTQLTRRQIGELEWTGKKKTGKFFGGDPRKTTIKQAKGEKEKKGCRMKKSGAYLLAIESRTLAECAKLST